MLDLLDSLKPYRGIQKAIESVAALPKIDARAFRAWLLHVV